MQCIRNYLASTGMTTGELAKRSGVSHFALCKYLKGEHEPRTKVLVKLADSTGIKIDMLVRDAAAAAAQFAAAE